MGPRLTPAGLAENECAPAIAVGNRGAPHDDIRPRGQVVARVRLEGIDRHVWNRGEPLRIRADVCAKLEKCLWAAVVERLLHPRTYVDWCARHQHTPCLEVLPNAERHRKTRVERLVA